MAAAGAGEKAPPLAKHDASVLDLAFAMDCTGSMGSYIQSARNNVRSIVEAIVAAEKSDVRLALVEYRDHPPQDSTFVTRPHDFTGSVSTMKQWLDACSAQGGGDTPEAVADALHDVLKLSWREESCKICVLIADAPPHGLCAAGDSFPNGCPAGLDPMSLVREMAAKGITLYVVGCEPSLAPHKAFFAALAHLTGGQYVPLTSARALTQVIIGSAQEEMSLEQLMADVNAEVLAEAQSRGQDNLDEEELSRRVWSNLKAKGAQSKQLQNAGAALKAPSASAIRYSDFTNMADLRAEYKPEGGGGFGMAPPVPLARGRRPGAPPPPFASPPVMNMEVTDCFSAAPPPPPRSGFGAMDAEVPGDVYETAEVEVDFVQAQRMVKKSIARNFKSK